MRISDHAVLRYLERRRGIDVKAARREMAVAVDTARMRDAVAFAGASAWSIRSGGMVYCLRGDLVTTCFPKSRVWLSG